MRSKGCRGWMWGMWWIWGGRSHTFRAVWDSCMKAGRRRLSAGDPSLEWSHPSQLRAQDSTWRGRYWNTGLNKRERTEGKEGWWIWIGMEQWEGWGRGNGWGGGKGRVGWKNWDSYGWLSLSRMDWWLQVDT